MKGLQVTEAGKVQFKTFTKQYQLKENEVKINVIYGGICGSDIAVYKGKLPHAQYPVVPGHEIIGEIIATGENATKAIGQRVVVQPNTHCDKCSFCKMGKKNVCIHKQSLGINQDGGFVEQFIVNEKYTIDIPDALSNERAILIEPLAVIVHGFKKCFNKTKQSVAVIGCGTEGMLAIALAHYLGNEVTAIDVDREKLTKIKATFPTVTTMTPNEVQEDQYDIVVEVAGVAASFEQSIAIAKPAGHILAIGFPESAEIPVVKLVRKELTIHGSIIYHVPEDFLTSIDYLLDENFRVESIIAKVFPIDQYIQAYEMAASGKYRKIILSFK